MLDLVFVTVFVWVSVLVIHRFDLPDALATWSLTHGDWAIDEVTMVSLTVVAALGVFSWRRWQESLRVIARHEATLERLRSTEGEIASKDRLIRSVSHELRTPLTAVLGYAELLGDGGLEGAERDAMVDTILRQGRDLANIVEDLLTRAHAEAETLHMARVPLHLAAQTAQVLEAGDPVLHGKVRFDKNPEIRAEGDPARVRQIIRNLISNAVRYGKGEIRVSVHRDGETATLDVADQGPEIPAAEQERIFDPYHRAPGSTAVPGGLGLGLSISRQLARLMDGDLSYRRDGEWSVFSLALPALDE